MSRDGFQRFPVVAVLLGVLILGACLAGLAESASPAYRVCSVAKGEELSASKTSPLSLSEVSVVRSTLPGELPLSWALPVELTLHFLSADLCEHPSSRAPPTLL